MALMVTIIVGPVLITSDLRNNGLALYFSRPLRRWEYALGKALVLGILLSIITWIPGMLLFLFPSYLEGFDWMKQNYRVGIGILVLPPVVNQFQELVSRLPGFAQALEQKVAELAERYPILQGTAFGSERGGLVEGMITDASSFVRGSAVPYLTTGGKMAVELFSVLAMAIYMARNPSMYRDGVMSLVPPKHRQLRLQCPRSPTSLRRPQRPANPLWSLADV